MGVAQRIRGRWRLATLAVLCVTLLLTSLDTTILNVALPSIVRSLHATSSELQWIVDAYAVVFAGLLLTLGALGDRIGRKWVFMAGLVVFGTGSALAAFSDTPDRLTAARAVMGVGAAALMPCTLSILTNTFAAERERAAAIGIWSGTAGLGVAIGPILGGFLLVRFWWGSVFLINVPIAALGLLASVFLVPNSKNPAAKRSDPMGAVLSIAGFSLLLWGIIEAPDRTWTSPLVLGAFALSAAVLTAFVVWERRSTHPMLPMRFFRSRRYSAAIGSLAMVLFALLGMFFLLTQYLQFFLGFSPLRTGVAIAPIAAVLLVAAPSSVWLVRRVGTKLVVAGGMALIAIGAGVLAGTSVHDGYARAVPAFALIGLGGRFGPRAVHRVHHGLAPTPGGRRRLRDERHLNAAGRCARCRRPGHSPQHPVPRHGGAVAGAQTSAAEHRLPGRRVARRGAGRRGAHPGPGGTAVGGGGPSWVHLGNRPGLHRGRDRRRRGGMRGAGPPAVAPAPSGRGRRRPGRG